MRLAALLFCAVSASAATQPVFDGPRTVPVGDGAAAAVRAADFDKDGKLDAAVLRVTPGGSVVLTVHRGKGDGSFAAPVATPLAEATIAEPHMEVADLDGNAIPDLVVSWNASGRSTSIRSWLGNGSGGFTGGAAADTAPRGCWSNAFALGDMNSDGRADVVVCNVLVIPMSAGGNFGAPVYAQAEGGEEIHLFDANGDGKRDVLVTRPGGALLLGNGDGTLQAPAAVPVNGSTAAADFDGNGRVDLTWLDPSMGDRATRLGLASGGWGERVSSGFVGESGAGTLLVADVSGDNRPDVLVGLEAHLYAWLTLPDGSSAAPVLYLSGTGSSVLATGDFDSDGAVDVLTAGATEGGDSAPSVSLSLMRGAGGGAFRANRGFPLAHRSGDGTWSGDGATALALSDVNGDGRLDVVALTKRNLAVLAAQAGGNLAAPVLTPLSDADRATFADFDDDGRVDAMVTSISGASHTCWLAGSEGAFRSAATLTTSEFGTGAAGDFDGDGRRDFLHLSAAGARLFRGSGNGTFAPPLVTPEEVQSTFAVVADVNGDGRDDAVCDGFLLLGHLGGGFTKIAHSATPGVRPLVIDANHDGRADLLTVAGWPDQRAATLFSGRGDGTFAPGVSVPVAARGQGVPVTSADVDRDGMPDALFGTSILFGAAGGTFERFARYRLPAAIAATAAGDIDGNGSPDLVIASERTHSVDVVPTFNGTSLDLPLPLLLATPPATAQLGEPFDVTATATPGSTFAPQSAAVFRMGSTVVGIAELWGETARARVRPAAVGAQSVRAVAGADPVYAAAETGAASIDVSKGKSYFRIEVTPRAPRATDPVLVSGSVYASIGTPVPGSTVTISLEGTPIATSTAPDFSFDLGKLRAGEHAMRLQYAGDANYLGASWLQTITVLTPAVRMHFAATPAATAPPSTPVTLTATFPDNPSLTGTVRFLLDGNYLGQAAVVAGSAAMTTSLLPPGRHRLEAQFTGNTDYSATTEGFDYLIDAGSGKRRGVRSH